jgi:malonate decarboxylase beta subunit
MLEVAPSWYEQSARGRIEALLEPGTFREFLGPEQRVLSPHLLQFNLPPAFDDGLIVGSGRVRDQRILVAAQEGRFMGGAIGEVHGAKLLGLLRAAAALPASVLILFDTGGVRLQEANAGEVAVAEIMRAVLAARAAGVAIVGLIGGRAGCFGGGGLIAACCSRLIVSEAGRVGVTGPEVIESNKGVEEFDSADRALVWRTFGGKHRRLIGGADYFVEDSAESFREAALIALAHAPALDLASMEAEQARLARRLARCGDTRDAVQVWTRLGVADPAHVPDLSTQDFRGLVSGLSDVNHDAR